MINYVARPPTGPEVFSNADEGIRLEAGDPARIAEVFRTPLTGAYAWDYRQQDRTLQKLYQLGRTRGWNPDTDVDWTVPLARDQLPFAENGSNPYAGWPAWEALSAPQQVQFAWHQLAWRMSQYLHGEQGALLVASQLVSCAPTNEGKLYAASQTFDEARHVEVFSRYVRERLRLIYPVSRGLKALLDKILTDERWDLKLIGMQLIIESLALTALPLAKTRTTDRAQHQIVDLVLRDEARHVAFGMAYLQQFIRDLPEEEREQRATFALEACMVMRDDIAPIDAYVHFGMDPGEGRRRFLDSGELQMFRKLLFARIMPNLAKIGLVTDRVAPRYERLGLLDLTALPDDTVIDWISLEAPIPQRPSKSKGAERL